jgi:hypothetical protein
MFMSLSLRMSRVGRSAVKNVMRFGVGLSIQVWHIRVLRAKTSQKQALFKGMVKIAFYM